jgi:SAM-dependent methyltransferase
LHPNDSEVFLDFGSGKGKALLIAGQLPYAKVLGVELRAELAESARHNIARARRRLRAGHVECEVSNVLTWPIPDDTSTIFMYNPFFGQTFRTVMSRVFESYDRNPRKLHIVYQYPLEHNWLISTGRVAVENVRSSRWPARRHWWVDENEKVLVTYHVGTGNKAEADCGGPHRWPDSEAVRRWRTTVPTLRASSFARLG